MFLWSFLHMDFKDWNWRTSFAPSTHGLSVASEFLAAVQETGIAEQKDKSYVQWQRLFMADIHQPSNMDLHLKVFRATQTLHLTWCFLMIKSTYIGLSYSWSCVLTMWLKPVSGDHGCSVVGCTSCVTVLLSMAIFRPTDQSFLLVVFNSTAHCRVYWLVLLSPAGKFCYVSKGERAVHERSSQS